MGESNGNRFAEVREKIHRAQYLALKQVNKQLIQLYWDIGRMIIENQQNLGWGNSVVQQLAKDLQHAMPGVRGFSARNLWNMREFYQHYYENEKLQPLVAEISWTKNILILSKCKDDMEREFYLKMTKKFGWTKSVLIHQMEGKSYEKYLLNQTSFDQTVPEKYKTQAQLAVKDEYTFEFLGLAEEHSEQELERSMINNIRAFLAEMGGDFTFIGNQHRVTVGQSDFYIDLLLFHRRLRALIAIELKVGKFQPEHKGKMEFYLTALNESMKLPEEEDAIGIIICKDKDRTVVEYALKTATHPIGVASYTLTSTLPRDYEGLLPSEDEIVKRLERLDS